MKNLDQEIKYNIDLETSKISIIDIGSNSIRMRTISIIVLTVYFLFCKIDKNRLVKDKAIVCTTLVCLNFKKI